MKIHRLVALGALAFLSLAGSGCSSDILDPVIEIPEKRYVVVVPFRDMNYDNGFDSPLGSDLATRVTRLIKEKGEFRVRPIQLVIELYQEDNPRNLTAKEVAEKTKADYVIMGDVIRWRLADENMYGGLKRGSCSIDISIYETADAAMERLDGTDDKEDLPKNGRGRLAIAKKRVSAAFPQEYGMKEYGSYDMTDEQIETGLLNSAALQIAWILVPHTKDEDRLMQGK
ncbi:MAG: hypothetical protein ACAI25_10720 [Planctomycetota bacterium]